MATRWKFVTVTIFFRLAPGIEGRRDGATVIEKPVCR